MRAREFIREEVIKADIDWQQWAAAMAAQAIEQDLPRGIDAIVYLGIIGDPSRTNIDIRMNRPVQIGLDMSPKGQGYLGSATGQYFKHGIKGMNGPESLKVSQDFDILLNFNGETPAAWIKSNNPYGSMIGHELMHRGMEIISNIGPILDKIPERSKFVFQEGNRWKKAIPGLFDAEKLDTSQGDYRASRAVSDSHLEHMLLYSMDPSKSSLNDPNRARYAEQVRKFRQIYFDIEGAARAYVLSYPIPTGSLSALRKEIDNKTPADVDVKVAMGPNNTPTVILQPEKPAAAPPAPAAAPPAPAKPAAPAAPTAPAAAEKPTAEKPAVAAPTAEKPIAATTPKTYTVQRGDILGRIAQRFYKGRLSDLLRANPQFTSNGRNPNLIFPGDQVIIPD